MIVNKVTSAQVYPLRLLVLRPGGTLQDCIFPGDEDATTIHFASHDAGGHVVGIASFYSNGHALIEARTAVQLRGMATHPEYRGAGYGKAIVQHAAKFFAERQVNVMWCNARDVARNFYESLGFVVIGAPFDIKGIGKHWVMSRPLTP